MKRIILVFLGLFSLLYSFGQGSPTGSKTQFKNGVALGSKDSSSFTANDSLFLTIDRNNRLMWRGNGASSRWYVIPFTNGSDTLPDTRWVRLQTGNLFRQTGKMWISDTIRTSGFILGSNLLTVSTSSAQALSGNNTSTGRGLFAQALGNNAAMLSNTSNDSSAVRIVNNGNAEIASFENSFGDVAAISNDGGLQQFNSGFWGRTLPTTLSANRTYSLPNASGTIALTSNVTDSASALRASINTKLNISDTAAMLAPFVQYSDTSNQMSGYLRKNFALLLQDTATAFSVRPLNNRFLDSISTIRALANAKGDGSVTSVALAMPSIFSVSGSPIITSGTFSVSLSNQSANLVFASPTTGTPAQPTFRSLVVADIPDLSSLYPTVTRFSDSISAIRTLANSKYTGGTVTSVATNNSTGITGGTITTTGTLAIDTTTIISTKLNVLNQLNKYTGSTNIVTLGTITTGVWNGTAIANANLQNSSITINGNSVSLGGSTTVTANTPNSITFNNGGAGGASGSTFNGGSALTVSYNTLGALATADTAAMKATITFDRVLANGNTTGRTFTAGGATLTGALSGTSGTFSGNIGIGTTSPSQKFHIVGGNSLLTTSSDVTGGYFQFLTGASTGGGLIGVEGNTANTLLTGTLPYASVISSTSSSTALQFGSSGSVKMTLTSAGRFLVGTTTDDGSSRVQVNGNVLVSEGFLNINRTSANPLVTFSLSGSTNAFVGVAQSNNGIVAGSLVGDLVLRTEVKNFRVSTDGGVSSALSLAATTGAATFTSDVTLGGAAGNRTLSIQTNTSGNPILELAANGVDGGSIYYNRATAELTFSNSATSAALKIATNGAATFSSSVTAKTYAENVVSVSTTYTVASDVGTVYASSNTYTITLPSAIGNAGRTITIKRTSAGLGTSITISGVTLGTSENGGSLPCHAAAVYRSDGTNWYCISYHAGGCN